MSNRRLLRISEVSHITGLGVSTIWARVARKEFPSPIPVGVRGRRWVDSEIHEYVERVIATARGSAAQGRHADGAAR